MLLLLDALNHMGWDCRINRVQKVLSFATATQAIIQQGAHSINSLSLLAC